MKRHPPDPTVMVGLTNESSPSWRPVRATHITGDTYRLTGPMPAYEQWEFKTGQVVHCREMEFADGTKAMVAHSVG